MCSYQFNSLDSSTPRYLADSSHLRIRPLRSNQTVIAFAFYKLRRRCTSPGEKTCPIAFSHSHSCCRPSWRMTMTVVGWLDFLYTTQSSAKSLECDLMLAGRSLINSRQSTGPKTLPWGIPLLTWAGSDATPSTVTLWDLSVRNALIQFKVLPITKTCLYSFDPIKPHFYIVKLGFIGVYINFLISAQNIDCGYSLEPPHRGGSNEYAQSMFWAEIWKISEFFIWKFSCFGVKIFNIFVGVFS